MRRQKSDDSPYLYRLTATKIRQIKENAKENGKENTISYNVNPINSRTKTFQVKMYPFAA